MSKQAAPTPLSPPRAGGGVVDTASIAGLSSSSPLSAAGSPSGAATRSVRDVMDVLLFGDLSSVEFKKTVFELQGIVQQNVDFAEEFLDRAGLQLIVDLVKKAAGTSVQSHLLLVLKQLLNYVNAIEAVKEQPELVDKIYYQLAPPGDGAPPNINVIKATLEVLIVLCHVLPNGRELIHDAAKRRAGPDAKPYAILAPYLTSQDLLCVRNTLLFMNVLLRKAREAREVSGSGGTGPSAGSGGGSNNNKLASASSGVSGNPMAGEHEAKNLVFRWKEAGLLSLMKPLTAVDDNAVKDQLALFQKQSEFVVPRSWEAAEKYRVMYEDMRRRYETANESLFIYQQQQAKVKLLKLEFQRAQETLKLLGGAVPSMSRHPHPTKRFEHGGGLSIKELSSNNSNDAAAGNASGSVSVKSNSLVDVDVPQDAVKEMTALRKQLLEKFLTSVDIRSFAEHTLNIQVQGGGARHGTRRAGGSYFNPAAHLYNDDPPPPTDSDDMLPSDDDDELPPDDDDDLPPSDDDDDFGGGMQKTKSGGKPAAKAGGKKGGRGAGGGRRDGGGFDDDDPPPSDDDFPDDDEIAQTDNKKAAAGAGAGAAGAAAGGASAGDNSGAAGTAASSDAGTAAHADPSSTGATAASAAAAAAAAAAQRAAAAGSRCAGAPTATPATGATATAAAVPVKLPAKLPTGGKLPMIGKMPVMGKKAAGGAAVDERKFYNGKLPEKKMRPLHWDKIPLTSLEGTIWERIHGGDDPVAAASARKVDGEFDYAEFEVMFSQKEVAKDDGKSKKKDDEKPMLVDPKTFMNFSIMLHKLPPIPTIQRAIQELDTQTLKKDQIQALLNASEEKAMPSDMIKEFRAKQHTKDVSEYNAPEQFVAMVLSMGDLFKPRLAAWTFTLSWKDSMSTMRAPLVRASTVMDAILRSQHLPYYLALLLGFGNLMNHGSPKGNAPAVMLSILGKLDAAKDNRGKTSLMQHLLNTVRLRNPAALELAEELRCLWSENGGDQNLKLDDMEKSVTEAGGQLNLFNAHCATVKRLMANDPMAGSDPFGPEMAQYAVQAQSDLEEAKQLLETAKGRYKALVRYFGYPEKRAPKLEEMVSELAQFIVKVRKVADDAAKDARKTARKGQKLDKGGLDSMVGALQEQLVNG